MAPPTGKQTKGLVIPQSAPALTTVPSRSLEGVGVLHTTPAARPQGHEIVSRKKGWWTVCVYMEGCGTYTGAYIGNRNEGEPRH